MAQLVEQLIRNQKGIIFVNLTIPDRNLEEFYMPE